ncbi:MAG: diaminopimelate decarboxylase [Oscillospiraceae bacterium]|nr:diaminopimelate decarboxylase [Oscillospiraceae bacterium]
MFVCENIAVGADGRLSFAGQSVRALAEEYGTPLYLMDEDRIRHNCRVYLDAFRRCFRTGSMPLYASKASSFRRIYQIMAEEGMGVDVVSAGEIYTAAQAGFDMGKAYFHGNNKTPEDIAFSMEQGVGWIVIDCAGELEAVEAEAARRGIRQKALLRITPGIDPHTYEAVATGRVDSKFGTPIETGQAEALLIQTLQCPHIELTGFHCHVGSQVFGEDVFERTTEVMLCFMAEMRSRHGYTAQQLDLGGGYGVRYVDTDPALDIGAKIERVASTLKALCASLDYPEPLMLMEPGRSIVADAGMTVYRVGSVRKIPGFKNYISVDGGMTDNPRFALYGSRYSVLLEASPAEKGETAWDVVGRCCESGDILQPNVNLPEPNCGDLLAICTTGAYNYSMASNYNRIPRPPIVMLHGGQSSLAVKRETLEDLIRLDV